MKKAKGQKGYFEAVSQLRKIKALMDDVGVPKEIVFSEEPNKRRSDLPARVEWALAALVGKARVERTG